MATANHRIGVSPWVALCTAWLAVAGCSPATDDDDTAAEDPPGWQAPDQRGAYEAGFITLTTTDPRGKELTIEVWYPARPADGDEPDSYWPDLEFVFEGFRDAPPDPRGAPYPLAAFSHGYGGIRYQSPCLTEHLARHGFVVVAVDHNHNTLMDLDMDFAAQVLAERPGDVRYAVDHVLQRSAEGDTRLGGMIDGPDYAMLGHSFGAVTTLIMAGGEQVHAAAGARLPDDVFPGPLIRPAEPAR